MSTTAVSPIVSPRLAAAHAMLMILIGGLPLAGLKPYGPAGGRCVRRLCGSAPVPVMGAPIV